MNWVKVYDLLYSHYGPQGWWPLLHSKPKKDISQIKIFCRYHSGNHSHPHNIKEKFEIGVGAILTQNTTFIAVEKCLVELYRCCPSQGITPATLMQLGRKKIASAILPARYPNRKAEYLLCWAEFFSQLKNKTPERRDLLSLRGIGEETADSILLYAFNQPEFVIDAYTCRILSHLDRTPKRYRSYRETKFVFESSLSAAFVKLEKRVKVYQEYHALLVVHAKKFYSRKPYGKNASGKDCFLKISYDKIIS